MKISLACITGNCQNEINRFLDHFQPHFDELIIVRAIGTLEPDDTIDIAKARGCITGEYFNAIPDWPHVDNFAAARQKAWNMATGDWIVWADMDDLSEGIEKMHEMLEVLPPDFDLLQCPYVVPDQRIAHNLRERAARRGVAKWDGALHECMTGADKPVLKSAITDKIRWVHSPLATRTPGRERNLRILEHLDPSLRSHGHLFYLFGELAATPDRKPEALKIAQQFLAHPEAGAVERYEVYLQISQMPDDPATTASFLHQATQVAPGRAEAWYELANLELTCGDREKALAYARICLACPFPEQAAWNTRGQFYGSFARSLHRQAMRMTSQSKRADVEEFNEWVLAGGDITLCHATRGRPARASQARQAWLDRAKHPDRIEHIFAFDLSDEESYPLSRFKSVALAGNGGCVAAWNAAAKAANGSILVQMSDDWLPPLHWDEEIRTRLDATKSQVLAISDGHRKDDLLCMAILTRKRYDHQGWMFHPEFTGVFSDNYFTAQAYADGVVIPAQDLVFEHRHPIFTGEPMDATYSEQNSDAAYKRGQAVFDRITAGIITSHDVQGWCDYRDFYTTIATRLNDGDSFVEIGAWKGQSIIHLAQELQNLGKHNVKLFAVDTFKGEQDQPAHVAEVHRLGGSIRSEFEANIFAARVDDMITIIESDSVKAASRFDDGAIDGVFIDAAHEYEPVKADIAAWLPKLKPGGIFAGHDYPHPPVKQAVDEAFEVAATSNRCWIKK